MTAVLGNLMPLICDAHIHLYPRYDLATALASAINNLQRLADDINPTALKCCVLAEPSYLSAFDELAQSRSPLPPGYTCSVLENGRSLSIQSRAGAELILIAGRQYATAERLELLALGSSQAISNGLPWRQAWEQVQSLGAMAVLNWAPGKWCGRRARLVAALLKEYRPESLLLGDTALRPAGWPEPRLMRQGRAAGFRVISGSDPFPQAAEELRLGSYGLFSPADLDPKQPAATLLALLNDSQTEFRAVGKRCSASQVLVKLIKHRCRY